MKARYQRRLDTLTRIFEFLTQHPIAIPLVITLLAKLHDLSTQMLAYGAGQIHGFGRFRSGATQRRGLAKELHLRLREMSDTARGLDPAEFPGVFERFRAKQSYGNYQKLLTTARAFLSAASEMKEVFIERAYPEDFDERLNVTIEEFAAATQQKDSGRQEQREGTAGLDILSRRVTQILRELDSIVTRHLRATDSTLLVVWKSTARTYRDPERSASPDEVPSQPSPVAEEAKRANSLGQSLNRDLVTGNDPTSARHPYPIPPQSPTRQTSPRDATAPVSVASECSRPGTGHPAKGVLFTPAAP